MFALAKKLFGSDELSFLADAKRAQQLTTADSATYSADRIFLNHPPTIDPASKVKADNWISWRAASYPAKRHSEYLCIMPGDLKKSPKILLSAVLDISNGLDDYLSRFDSKQRYDIMGKKAKARGYTARSIVPREHSAEIHAIIHSSDSRQGRDIAPLFNERPADYPFTEYEGYTDANYQDICVGVFSASGDMVAYLLGKRVGHHVQYDEIMGHAEHLDNRIMFLLHYAFLESCVSQDTIPNCLNYGAWYSGANPFDPNGGLNFWKRKTRFTPAYLIATPGQ